jgi:tRNA(Ile)-lysidine synthase
VAVAVSGGRDSVALLHATHAGARALGIEVHALHVHHGLQPQADDWQAHVEALCREWQVPLHVHRLRTKPEAGDSIEAWARRERYRALARMAQEAGIGLVLLAHHRRDQAETFLLQALRGAGPAGLAAMPGSADRQGITWARPWLAQPREAVEAYAAAHGLRHVDDPSNADARYARNRLRLQVMPALGAAFPDAEPALAAAAARMAEAQAALAEWAAADLAACEEGGQLVLDRWQGLSAARRGVVLRLWLRRQLGRGAPQRLAERLMSEWPQASRSASWPVADGRVLRSHRGRLLTTQAGQPEAGAADASTPEPLVLAIDAPGHYPQPAWHGMLVVSPVVTEGVPLGWLAECRLQARQGGEQFQLAAGRPARSLKKAFQAADVPAWARGGPLLWAQGRLVFVPGLGLDAHARQAPPAQPGSPLVALEWRPDAAAGAGPVAAG